MGTFNIKIVGANSDHWTLKEHKLNPDDIQDFCSKILIRFSRFLLDKSGNNITLKPIQH